MPWNPSKPDLKNDPRYLEPKVNDLTSQLAQTVKVINVKAFGAKGNARFKQVGGGFFQDSNLTIPATDDTNAIIEAINSANHGDTIFFPEGHYAISGIVIKKPINIVGNSMRGSIIRNFGVGQDAIRFEKDTSLMEAYVIENITIEGNGGQNGVGGTTGSGLVFDTSWMFYLKNVNSWFHGGHGLHLKSSNYTVFVSDCRFERNKLDGVRGVGNLIGSQFNATRFVNCRVGDNGKNGYNIWGTSLSILNNTIEGNAEYGVKLSSDEAGTNNSCTMVSIKDNYMEFNADGCLYVKASASAGSTISGLVIDGNYGLHPNQSGSTHPSGKSYSNHAVIFDGTPFNKFNRSIRDVYYGVNHFVQRKTDSFAVNFGNMLGPDSIIKSNFRGTTHTLSHTNIGKATQQNLVTKKIMNGHLLSKGTITYPNIKDLSDNIPLNLSSGGGAIAVFPLGLKGGDWISEFGISINTDCSRYAIDFQLVRINGDGTETVVKNSSGLGSVNGSINIATDDDRIVDGDFDIILRLRIYTYGDSTQTFMRVGNPYIIINS